MQALILIVFATAIIYLYFGAEQLFQQKRLWYGILIGSFFLSLSFNLMIASAHFSGMMINFSWAHQIHMPFYFILGPLCYLIFFYSDDQYKFFQKKSYLHFLIPLLSIIVMAPYYITPSVEKIRIITTGMGMGLHWTEYVEQLGGFIFIFYIGWIYYDYSKKRVWSKYAVLFFYPTAITVIVEVLMIAAAFLLQSRVLFVLALTLQLLYITVIYSLARIFPDYFAHLADSAVSYRNSSLRTLDNARLSRQLQELLEKKVYLDTDLSSSSFCRDLGISDRQLSEFLSKTYGENFRTFINGFRIRYVNSELLNSPEKKIIEIAYEAGFNSISVFNSVYKNFNGKTPRDYRKSKSRI